MTQARIVLNNGLEIDISAIITEDHTYSLEPTRNIVEEGSDITDHIKRVPRTIALSGIVSDYDVDISTTIDQATSLLTGDGQYASKSESAKDAFKSIYDNKMTVTILTKNTAYWNMVMTSYSYTTDRNNSESLEFSASFTEIVIVQSTQVVSTDLSTIRKNQLGDGVGKTADPKKKIGNQDKNQAVPADATEEGSVAWKLNNQGGKPAVDFVNLF